MRLLLVAAIVVLALVAVPATAAATTYTDTVAGAEIAATSTQGTFVGKANGDLPGVWKAVVQHTPLSPNATITGGSFKLVTTTLQTIVGTFATGGSVIRTQAGTGCTNQQYTVEDGLSNVGVGGPGSGTGSFQVVLTHYRAFVPFVGCVTFSATVQGMLSLTL
jgi:hypothetical protein